MAVFDKGETCCFTGHRCIAPNERFSVRQCLSEAIAGLIASGYTTFICGGATGFDTIAGRIVMEMKKLHTGLCLAVMVPCDDQAERWSEADKREYAHLIESADYVECMADKYFDGCMLMRNRRMVECSSVCVAYMRRDKTGTSQTIRLAREQGLRVIRL